MTQSLFNRKSLTLIFLQAFPNEFTAVRWNLFLKIFSKRYWLTSNIIFSISTTFHKRMLSSQAHEQHNPKGPNINFLIILLKIQHLWSTEILLSLFAYDLLRFFNGNTEIDDL